MEISMNYISVAEVAVMWNISKRRVQLLCAQGRIKNAERIGNMWVVPVESDKPFDARIKKSCSKNICDIRNNKPRLELKNCICKIVKEFKGQYDDITIFRSDILSSLSIELFKQYIPNKLECIAVVSKQLHSYNSPAIVLMGEYFSLLLKNNPDNFENYLSWSYQYLNEVIESNIFSDTQFFTEKYMIHSIIRELNIVKTDRILDPACGGGNFLTSALEYLFEKANGKEEKLLIKCISNLYGYELDSLLARVAFLNIQLKACSIMSLNRMSISFDFLSKVNPNIYCSANTNKIGSIDTNQHEVISCVNSTAITHLSTIYKCADVIITNPPFLTIKGMDLELKKYLKMNYSICKCDVCNAFMLHILLSSNSNCKIGMVVQNSWMFLSSFTEFRKKFLYNCDLKTIVDLGSNSFYDLTGEKANVSLITFEHKNDLNDVVIVDLKKLSLNEKEKILLSSNGKKVYEKHFTQKTFENNKNHEIDYMMSTEINCKSDVFESYSNYAVPMQGTSTGNSKELLGYFWNHFNDSNWKLVSKGGGYCRWYGLNFYKIKWGESGEFIKSTKGSALRNVKYFDETDVVFSDTGRSGLNARSLAPANIFVASGPGIRMKKGDYHAHLAFLNSRVASYFLRCSTPKLTIAAGYIGKIPVSTELIFSSKLSMLGRKCISIKKRFYSKRSNYYDYNWSIGYEEDVYLNAKKEFLNDIKDELHKLKYESQIERIVLESYKISDDDISRIEFEVGICAYDINKEVNICTKDLDNIISKLLSESCELSRTRTSINHLGCDGILEFISIQCNISPAKLLVFIESNIEYFPISISKYVDMILHNLILNELNYNPQTGVDVNRIFDLSSIILSLDSKIANGNIEKWVVCNFNKIHYGIYKKNPFLVYDASQKLFIVKGENQWV